MTNLIATGIPLGVRAGREWVEIPSRAFSAACRAAAAERDPRDGPLPPP